MKPLINLTLAASILATGFSGAAFGDSDEGFFKSWRFFSGSGVSRVENTFYRDECGSCHMAYQPGLLPEKSWEKIMVGLDDHFGENAEMDPADAEKILDYLRSNAASSLWGMRDAPMRITELSRFRHEHDELPARVVRDNPDVRSFSNCDACHTRADKGIFNEHDVVIPGYGRYDDD